jgi:tRNA A-37 threonylcarbamoyl transferase component Bud32
VTDGAGSDLPAVPDDFVAIGPPIASGGSAVVWRARHRVTGREVALKVWHHPLSSAEQRAQFDAESRLHQQLSGHPHIVPWLWAAAPADAPAWMATELYGEALSELTAESGPLGVQKGVVIGLDLLDGLAAVHAKGVVHRDVKPENVLVKDGRAALCDLGIAMHIDTLTGDTGAGTIAYLAPELLRRGADQSPDFSSDVYSAARTIRTAVGDDIPDALDQLLTRAESEEPADRPADAADFRNRLLKVSDRLGLAAPVDPVEPDHPPRGRRRSLILVAACIVAVAIIATTVGLLVANRNADSPSPSRVAARQAPSDIDAGGKPVSLGQRSGGRCSGDPMPDGRYEHVVNGQVVAVTKVFYDPDKHEACALLTKDKSNGGFGSSSYLALTLCNSAGVCDSDWFNYPHEAGPVKVQSVDNGCVSWRSSMQDPQGTEWLVRDVVRQVGC